MKKLTSIGVWVVAALLTFILFLELVVLYVVLWPFDKKRKVLHGQCFWWANAVIGLNPYWKLHVSGLENIDKHKTYVVIANHQSLSDTIILYKTGMQFKWVAKDGVFKIPIVGWCMSMVKHMRLIRGKPSSIKKVYRQASAWLKKGISVAFFPEGTRVTTEEMDPFKNGAFKLAIREKKPVLPILITGTRDLIQRGEWVFKSKTDCRLKVLPAVETKDLLTEDFRRLSDIVRQKLSENSVL
jgi:1-acyl-sn-glycerol-3-phosphate acyltransferase